MYLRLTLSCCLLLASGAAAQTNGTFSVPCQSREVFASRLRSVLPEPARAEQVLQRFSIEIAPDSEGAWTLTVRALQSPADEPRTLRQTSCTELAEAAVLIVAAWAVEAPPEPPRPPPMAAEPSEQPPRDERAWRVPDEPPRQPRAAATAPPVEKKPGLKLGAAVVCDGAINMLPTASVGASVAMWFLTANRRGLTTFGVSAWPTHHREPSEVLRLTDYERPLWTTFVQGTNYLVDIDPVYLGAYGGLYLATRRSDDGLDTELTILFTVGMAVRWALSQLFALRFQLGVAAGLAENKAPGIASISLDVAFN